MSDTSKEVKNPTNAHPDLSVLEGGVAIVTGGASGIGLALLERAMSQGMHAVIADIERDAIKKAEVRLRSLSSNADLKVLGVEVDVSSADQVEAMSRVVDEEFPDTPISLVAPNAGVGGGGPVLRAGDVDWDYTLGVNVKGVANCVRTFVPRIIERGNPASVVATSSQDGLCAAQGTYGVSKHACVALMEALHQELRGQSITTHVLCPNVVATNIVTSERNRPERFGGTPERQAAARRGNVIQDRFLAFGMPPSRCADFVFDSIECGIFYVMAEAEEDPGYVHLEVETRMKAIMEDGLPYRPPSKFIGRVFNPNTPLPKKRSS